MPHAEGAISVRPTPPGWSVRWHPQAIPEVRAIEGGPERNAIRHVIEKLQVDGPRLRSPHQSAVMGVTGAGLRELRPRRGRSRWRPIYRRRGERLFVILSVAPESEIDRAGYRRAVRKAKQRLDQLEG